MPDQYLPCGHPVGCRKEESWAVDIYASGMIAENYCAACERGGWVYCCPQKFEGLPPVAHNVDVAIVAEESDWPSVDIGWLSRHGIWCAELGEPFEHNGLTVYAWKERPAPPPVPEGELCR
jgi:hypothetical protein